MRVLADEKEARCLIQKWRKGEPVKTGDLVGLILYTNITNRKNGMRGSNVVSHSFALRSEK